MFLIFSDVTISIFEKMESIRIFKLLLFKAFLVRKRFWIKSAVVNILIPLSLLALAQCFKLLNSGTPTFVKNVTIYDVQTQQDITKPVKIWKLYYAPNTSFISEAINQTEQTFKNNHGSIGN